MPPPSPAVPTSEHAVMPMRRRISPLRSVRMLALLCIAVPVVVYGVVGTVRYRQLEAETDVRVQRAVQIAREHALKIFDTNDLVMARVTDALGAVSGYPPDIRAVRLHDQLRVLTSGKPHIQSVWVLDAQGRPVATDRFSPPPALDLSDRPYFKAHKAGNEGIYFSEPVDGRVTGTEVVHMSRARYRADGEFDGVVSLTFRPTYFEQFHSQLTAEEPGLAITLFRDDGGIISRFPRLPDGPRHLASNSPVMSQVLLGREEGAIRGVSSVDGRRRLLRFARVGDYPVYLGSGMELGEIRTRWWGEMMWLAAFGIPPLVALFLVGRLALRRTEDSLAAADRLQQETEARHRVEEALLQAQKLEALGRLTGGVAHDFNNALMVISNNLFILRRRAADNVRPQLDSMARAVDSATKLTRQLLAFSRRQALVPEYQRLQDRLPALQGLVAPVLGSQVRLHLHVEPDTAGVLLDAAEFELAVLNLAINSRDAMPTGGEFHLSARNGNPAGQPMVIVEARDTGSGIPPDVMRRVFEPFFTTKPVGQGTGLGLSQIAALCQRANGQVSIDSQPGAGTTVRLMLPAAVAPTTSAIPTAQAAPGHLNQHVLLVEDNPQVAAALVPVLEDLGCQVTHCPSAESARDWLLTQNTLPEVLLTDVVMPGGMDGLALAQRVRTAHPAMDIVVMTGYAEQVDQITLQGFEIVPKPCSADALSAAMQRARQRRLAGARAPAA